MSKELQAALAKLVGLISKLIERELDKGGDDDTEEPAPAPKPSPRPVKGSKKEEAEEDADEDGDDGDSDDADESEEDVESEDEDDADSDGPSLEDVIDTLKNYVGKNKNGEREKAVKLLKKKFGVANVNKLDSEHYAAAIKMFKK